MIEIPATDLQAGAKALRRKQKMEKRKAAQDAEVAAKMITQKGLLIVHTSKGNDKSTAAFGLLLRALGHEWPCGAEQIVKGACDTGKRRALAIRPCGFRDSNATTASSHMAAET